MKLQALIIEDDPAQQEIFTIAVEQAGYQATAIGDGEAALAYLQEHEVALVVLDLHLPGLGGEHIAREIRRLPHLAQTRIILASADDRLAEVLQDITDLVLLKPVAFGQLRDLAERLRNASEAAS